MFRTALFAVIFSLITGCTSMKVQDYAHTQPKFDLFNYFEGKTEAWGQFQDRFGTLKRRFKVSITGTVEGNVLTLDERFIYDDGEKQTRIWTITQTEDGHYIGTAEDVIGQAKGLSAGSVLNWSYTLALPIGERVVNVQFNDWMFLQDNTTMINRAEVSKWGIRLGEVTLFFKKS